MPNRLLPVLSTALWLLLTLLLLLAVIPLVQLPLALLGTPNAEGTLSNS